MAQGIAVNTLVIDGLGGTHTRTHAHAHTHTHTHTCVPIQELRLTSCNSLAKLTFKNLLIIKAPVMLENPPDNGLIILL